MQHRANLSPQAGEGRVASATQGSDLFGHPRGLSYLFATEMWERFSYYGMHALLVLYMVKYLFDPERAQTVIGLAALAERAGSRCSARSTSSRSSSQIYGFYTGLVYLTPVLGGYLADRVLGQRRTVVIGAALMAHRPFHDGVRAAVPVGAARC